MKKAWTAKFKKYDVLADVNNPKMSVSETNKVRTA
jgi:hypothetical protein